MKEWTPVTFLTPEVYEQFFFSFILNYPLFIIYKYIHSNHWLCSPDRRGVKTETDRMDKN
jgi:hypothetical protein